MTGQSLFHVLPIAVFSIMILGAMAVFSRMPGDRRDPRGALLGLSFWAIISSTYVATLAVPALVALGLAVLTLSLALFAWAALSIRGKTFSLAFTHDTPQFVHSTGPYAYLRNPFYASYILAGLGSIVIWPSWIGFSVVIAMVAYFNWLARFEEHKFAGSAVRAEYDAYRARTGRLIPRISRTAAASPSRAVE